MILKKLIALLIIFPLHAAKITFKLNDTRDKYIIEKSFSQKYYNPLEHTTGRRVYYELNEDTPQITLDLEEKDVLQIFIYETSFAQKMYKKSLGKKFRADFSRDIIIGIDRDGYYQEIQS
ncbi:hypothetical protein M1446_05630 [Candidatus Dependentiae bacterium]|nr:hypothetical protein [Candidatus Dependentiae bacterium]